MNNDFMKQKPVFPLILSMSLPMVISMLVNSLYNIIDSFFVAKIGENAMTALSLVFPIQNFINAVAIGFGIGINAVISIFLGGHQESGYRRFSGAYPRSRSRNSAYGGKHYRNAIFPANVY